MEYKLFLRSGFLFVKLSMIGLNILRDRNSLHLSWAFLDSLTYLIVYFILILI